MPLFPFQLEAKSASVMFGVMFESVASNTPFLVTIAPSICSVEALTKFPGAKSKNEALAGKSIFILDLNLDDIENPAPALNKLYAPSSKPIMIDVSIK